MYLPQLGCSTSSCSCLHPYVAPYQHNRLLHTTFGTYYVQLICQGTYILSCIHTNIAHLVLFVSLCLAANNHKKETHSYAYIHMYTHTHTNINWKKKKIKIHFKTQVYFQSLNKFSHGRKTLKYVHACVCMWLRESCFLLHSDSCLQIALIIQISS